DSFKRSSETIQHLLIQFGIPLSKDSSLSSLEVMSNKIWELKSYLTKYDIKNFDYSQFRNFQIIGSGAYATVYSATFKEEEYALKSLKKNLSLDEKELNQLQRELVTGGNLRDHLQTKKEKRVLLWELSNGVRPFQHFSDPQIVILISQKKREKTINNTPPNYATLYKKCWSTDPDRRPTLNYILKELEKLLVEPCIESIINNINQIITQPELYPNEDDLNEFEYDRCIECENKIDSLILNSLPLNELSFRIKSQSHDGFTSISTEQHKMIKPIELINGNLEDEILLSSTLHGIIENIAYFCSLTESSTW
ncbi:13756_t:CDS:2, partial [Dentiscutata erythropus]